MPLTSFRYFNTSQAIVIFCNEVKGLGTERDLAISYKSAFVLGQKLGEPMAEEMRRRTLRSEGKVAEIDRGYFSGYIKPANNNANRVDRRLVHNQNGKGKAVVIMRERNGHSLLGVFRTEGQALSFTRSRIAKGTISNAGEGSSWDARHATYEMKRINHQRRTITTASIADVAESVIGAAGNPMSWPDLLSATEDQSSAHRCFHVGHPRRRVCLQRILVNVPLDIKRSLGGDGHALILGEDVFRHEVQIVLEDDALFGQDRCVARIEAADLLAGDAANIVRRNVFDESFGQAFGEPDGVGLRVA